MSARSSIEWTDATWNPVRGCTRVSDGCRNCYAERVAHRFSGGEQPYEGLIDKRTGGWSGSIRLVPEALDEPLRWRKPRRVFVCSMSDLFHPDVPDEFIAAVFRTMVRCIGKHTFQVLTKRPERMRAFISRCAKSEAGWITHNGENPRGYHPGTGHIVTYASFTHTYRKVEVESENWPLPNVWLGTSVENHAAAEERIPELLATPAAVRFLSCEPLLGPVDLHDLIEPERDATGEHHYSALTCDVDPVDDPWDGACVDWVIAGGESGPNARPMHPDWARSLRDQCEAAGVPLFFKQWGEWAPTEALAAYMSGIRENATWFADKWNYGEEDIGGDGSYDELEPDVWRVGKKRAGRQLDGRTHDGMPA
ncbi:phage Gp37/Gp68 family protein [Algiphilus sp.]|uniref:phage Gp37/Gp68 family protein n=1 Tax=Algiphilus sp. TaxID=1872431 RepID=UPI0025B7CF0D|nr:phage Gp37/Gp68 family protein [Algiphilus sp.]MCK5769499.1 phage Gp37/Gp68 family protein [Algiphilus sp.]